MPRRKPIALLRYEDVEVVSEFFGLPIQMDRALFERAEREEFRIPELSDVVRGWEEFGSEHFAVGYLDIHSFP